MADCIFCKIADQKAPAKIVYENDSVICFLPDKMEVYGHTLVVPKKHYVDLYDIPTAVLGEIIKVAQNLTRAYKEKLGATGMNLMHASGRDGQQSIFHFHLHLLPRFHNDGLDTWPDLGQVEIDRNEFLKKLNLN